jgi:hypothetical protein
MDDEIKVLKGLATTCPSLARTLDEHVKDNHGQVLPHVVLGEITRQILKGGLSDRELHDVLRFLDEQYAGGNAQVQELIAASFLENLPRSGHAATTVRRMMGLNLRSKWKAMEAG